MTLKEAAAGIADALATVCNGVAEAIYICDSQGRLTFINDAAARRDGVSKERLYGRCFTDVYTLRGECPLDVALREQRRLSEATVAYVVDGREMVVAATACPLYENGLLIGACLITAATDAASPLPAAGGDGALTGDSAVFKECRETALTAAKGDSAIMLVGATGTGKEVFARAIHGAGPRKDGPFLALNCAAIPEDLLEGILFGTTKGVYTGAVEREGLFSRAKGGTLFLDELNSMPLSSQAKLLRVLEEKRVYRLGAADGEDIDVRIISSCNESPQEAVERGLLRKDLFYRLSVVYLRLPSLPERREDIPLLVEHFIEDYNRRFNKNVVGVADEVMAFFQSFPWPGNVRQLKHAIESAMNFTANGRGIGFSALPTYLFEEHPAAVPPAAVPPVNVPPVVPPAVPPAVGGDTGADSGASSRGATVMDDIRDAERAEIVAALRNAKGNMAQAARALGLTRQAMVYRVKKYGLK